MHWLNAIKTREHRQSYWDANPRQQQHMPIAACVTSNYATLTVFLTVWPWPFDLWVNACWATSIEYMCSKFGVGLLVAKAIFLLECGQTDKQTDRREWTPTHAGGYTADVGNYLIWLINLINFLLCCTCLHCLLAYFDLFYCYNVTLSWFFHIFRIYDKRHLQGCIKNFAHGGSMGHFRILFRMHSYFI